MAENHNPKTQQNPNHPQPLPPPPPPLPPQPPAPSIEAATNGGANGSFSGHKAKYSNPPDAFNPDAATLRDQWKFAIRQYSKWYSHAWGAAILAGGAFFALGWIIKGGNPLPSKDPHLQKSGDSDSGQIHGEK